MGLFSNREAELTELQRMVVRVKDPARRHELSAEDWPVAMVGYTLQMSEDPALLGDEGKEVYAAFAQAASSEARLSAFAQMSRFITARRGEGWRALLLYALCEPYHTLCTRVATLVLNMAPNTEAERFAGAAALVNLVAQQGASPGVLCALLHVADLRLLPLLEPLYHLPQSRAEALLRGLTVAVNSLSSAFLLSLLEAQPGLAPAITEALVRMAARTTLVADIVYPMPTWAYRQAAPQPLHAWTRQEFLPRMRPRLMPYLSAEQMQSLEVAFE